MKQFDMDRLILLPEKKAVRKFFDMHNYKWFRRMLFGFFTYGVVLLPITIIEDTTPAAPAAVCLLCVIGISIRRSRLVENHFTTVCVSFLILLFVILALPDELMDEGNPWALLLPFLVLVYRFHPLVTFLFYASVCTGLIFQGIYLDEIPGRSAASGVLFFMGMPLALYARRRKKAIFIEDWQLARNNKDRLRMKKELEQARDIQLSFLPPGDPELNGLQLSCLSEPASEVGGDYYFYYRLSESRTLLLVGDVSGHGVASGLVLSGVRSCLYLMRDAHENPGDMLRKLNLVLKETTDSRTFMTMLLIIIDHRSGLIQLANAGHPPLLHYRAADGKVEEIRRPALPLGAIREAAFAEETLYCATGDVLVLYSDGLTETMNETGEYGAARLRNELSIYGAANMNAGEIRNSLFNDVQTFAGDNEQDDDITLAVVRFPAEGYLEKMRT